MIATIEEGESWERELGCDVGIAFSSLMTVVWVTEPLNLGRVTVWTSVLNNARADTGMTLRLEEQHGSRSHNASRSSDIPSPCIVGPLAAYVLILKHSQPRLTLWIETWAGGDPTRPSPLDILTSTWYFPSRYCTLILVPVRQA